MEHKKKLQDIKDSITKYNNLSSDEKKNLIDSIEMLWLNASVSKKKKDIVFPESSNENITRIRQLLAAAWSEDIKE
jgi:hypothetical protein